MGRSKGKREEHRAVVETPSLTRFETGIVNQGFDSLTRFPSPSFFYIDNSGGWLDGSQSGYPSTNGMPRRFTESWIELEQAYSCGSTSSGSDSNCHCCRKFCRWFVYFIIALCVVGFAAIISAILYMEVLHEMYDAKELQSNETSTFATLNTTLFSNLSTSNANFTNSSEFGSKLFEEPHQLHPTSAPDDGLESRANVSTTLFSNVTDSVTEMLTIVLNKSSTPASTSASINTTNTINSSTSTESTNVSS
jgi:hypothetical protein